MHPCLITAVTLLAASSGAGHPVLGVIVAKSAAEVTPSQWGHLEALGAMPEVLSRYAAETPGASFDFTGLEEDVSAYAAHGMTVSLTVTAHLHTLPYQESIDENGAVYRDRHNPFDPVFAVEWGRLHQAFLEAFGDDPRIARVYIAPPSYYGETEYYMGPDWANLRFLAYDGLARDAFTRSLRGRYADLDALSEAWGTTVASWEDVPLPKPRRDGREPYLSTDWLDFMRWRTAFLTDLVAVELAQLAEGFHGEAGLKAAVGDFSAAHGVNTAAIVRRFPRERPLALHATNGHSLADLRYFSAILQHHGPGSLSIENDGNRFTRTELARILLTFHLAGADTFNFAHLGHFNLEPPTRSDSETARTLRSLRPWLERYDLGRTRRQVAFLHGNTTAWLRAPGYRNRDVSRAYDAALSNGAGPEVRAYAWARWLGLPDVTCEDLVLDGDLEGRRVVILPNSGVTLLPAAVRDRILAWVSEGGTLVTFGVDSLGRVLAENPTRVLPVDTWVFPPVVAGAVFPVFDGPADDRAVMTDAEGRAALLKLPVGSGAVYLFPAPVPEFRDGPWEVFYREVVPRQLRRIAMDAGVGFTVTVEADGKPVAPLALDYLGVDGKSGRHVFVGGAYDGSVPRFTVVPAPGLTGPAELLLVDEGRVAARAERGTAEAECNRPDPATVYADPTNTERALGAYIPCTTVRFDLPNRLEVALAPSL